MATLEAIQKNISAAAEAICNGELVGFPTETVYGLGADATNSTAVLKIFTTKGRPRFNPLIVHVANMIEAKKVASFNSLAEKLADAFWPGPMTLVLPMVNGSMISDVVVNGLKTVAIRIPTHPVACKLIETAGCPIAAPSANISGHISATTAEHVISDFGNKVSIVLDAGPSKHGLESTIIDTSENMITILRHGCIALDDVKIFTGRINKTFGSKVYPRPISPGQLISHYAPRCSVRLNILEPKPEEAFLAFGPEVPRHTGPIINLSSSGDLMEAASNLFAALRNLDATNSQCIAVMPIPNYGIGVAINDRLKRAASP
ncbi:MAG: Threonylcarbamoyl-AMP synthase [Hyphomicrobiaceae bacterium hypho_1]